MKKSKHKYHNEPSVLIQLLTAMARKVKKTSRPVNRIFRDISRASFPIKIGLVLIASITCSNLYNLWKRRNAGPADGIGLFDPSSFKWDDPDYIDPSISFGNLPEFLKGSKNLFKIPDDLQNIPDEACPNPFMANWENNQIQPAHSVNPNQFIIPILMGEAAQQFAGFQNAMALAVHLNRTLILPPMFRGEADMEVNGRDSDDTLIDSAIRVDIDSIRSYVNTVNLIKGVEICQGQIHVAFLARPVATLGRYQRVHEFEKLSAFRLTEGDLMAVPMQPEVEQISDINRGVVAPIDSDVWNQLYYNPQAVCAAYVLPYMSMEINPAWHQSQTEMSSLIQRELIEHSRIPLYAMAIAQDFLEMHYQGSSGFIGVHWKFDHNDWIKGCDKLDIPIKIQACQVLEKATHKDIAGGILGYMAEKFDTKKHSIVGVKNYGAYIATGDSDLAADQVADITIRVLDEIGGQGFVYTTSYLMKWLEKRYSQCVLTTDYTTEVIAMVEHHILYESKVLLFSSGDPASTRIMNDRKVAGKFSRPGDKNFVDVLTNFIMGQPVMKMNHMTKQELKKRLSELQVNN